MIISISGKAGTGKSSAAKILASKLNYEYFSIGALQREFAKEKQISLEELRRLENIDPKVDEEFDEFQKNLGKNKDNFIIDSRLGGFLIKKSIKVFLDCDDDIRLNRIINDTNPDRSVEFIENTKKDILKRDLEDQKRLLKQTGFDFLDMKNYNFVIDTSKISIEETADEIIKKIKDYK